MRSGRALGWSLMCALAMIAPRSVGGQPVAGPPAAALPTPANAPTAPTAPTAPPAPTSKKDQALADKAARGAKRTAPVAVVGRPPTPLVNVYNTWTDEWLAFGLEGALPPAEVVNNFLRCHYTQASTDINLRVFAMLPRAAKHFRGRRVDVVSAFRHDKYNLMLRKKGRQVARDSHHSHGTAIDFRLPGVSTETLRNWAQRQRLGGVGFYPDSKFVHMDVGPARTWVGK